MGYEEEVSPTALSDTHSPGVLTTLNPFGSESSRVFHECGVAPTVMSQTPGSSGHVPRVLTYGIRTANTSSNGRGVQEEQSHTLGCTDRDAVATNNGVVRRLTPLECERLQGFPDGWTRIPWRGNAASECPDAPRYRAIGNSMAVPVMRWIGERMDACDGFYDAHHDRLADFE